MAQLDSYIDLSYRFASSFFNLGSAVIEEMLGLRFRRRTIRIKHSDILLGDISATVFTSCSDFQGSVAILVGTSFFLHMTSSVLNEEFHEINDENRDVIVEVCRNMISNVRDHSEFNETVFPFYSNPLVVTGVAHHIKHNIEGKTITAEFESDYGVVLLESVVKR